MARRQPELSHIRPARPTDEPNIRELFERFLVDGGNKFDVVWPGGRPALGVLVPYYEVFVVTAGRRVVGVSWYELLDRCNVQVVVLTDPQYDEPTWQLLRYAQACVQVIASAGVIRLGTVTAWVPVGAHANRLSAAYTKQGWSRPNPMWLGLLQGATPRHEVLESVVRQATDAGITLRPLSPESSGIRELLSITGELPRPRYQLETLWEASRDGQILAVNGVTFNDAKVRTIAAEPVWIDDTARSPLISLALLARLLRGMTVMPDLLRADGRRPPLDDWFVTPLAWSEQGNYVLTVDHDRLLEPWEDTLGWNPYRLWLGLGTPVPRGVRRDDGVYERGDSRTIPNLR
ncbi:hypothetical protein E7T09_16210 [Deinococcus sp. KSM4-11]|uniref:hypothetical protein n=1 Tax=Deinococcus sp. KSM4-11 TaxID=2568654 RepID=UPI0010A4B505|nr:hypothetical protein [Deinococcus sp. KSM4-11]THF85499.1 hypothetical protein E7T09_16210 [Deinococcus sp. KSM4-11]